MMSEIINFSLIGTPEGDAITRQNIVHSLHRAISDMQRARQCLPAFIAEAIEWQVWANRRAFAGGMGGTKPMSAAEFLKSRYPVGIEISLEDLRELLALCPPSAMRDSAELALASLEDAARPGRAPTQTIAPPTSSTAV